MLQPPPSLFKYTKREHADLLVHQGRLRIGTLLDFQNIEKHRAEVGDTEEGTRTFIIKEEPSGTTSLENISFPGVEISGFTSSGNGLGAIASRQTSAQYYVLCTSITKDRAAMEKMRYDTCVEITNPLLFFLLLATRSQLASKIKSSKTVYGPCEYMPDVVLSASEADNKFITANTVDGIPTWLRKHPDFAYQTEYRAIWQPSDSNPQPLLLQCEEVRALCRIVDI